MLKFLFFASGFFLLASQNVFSQSCFEGSPENFQTDAEGSPVFVYAINVEAPLLNCPKGKYRSHQFGLGERFKIAVLSAGSRAEYPEHLLLIQEGIGDRSSTLLGWVLRKDFIKRSIPLKNPRDNIAYKALLISEPGAFENAVPLSHTPTLKKTDNHLAVGSFFYVFDVYPRSGKDAFLRGDVGGVKSLLLFSERNLESDSIGNNPMGWVDVKHVKF